MDEGTEQATTLGGNRASEQSKPEEIEKEPTKPAQVFGEMTEEEKEIAAALEEERETTVQLLSDHFGELFVDEQVAVTTGFSGNEGKVLIYHDQEAEWQEELTGLVVESSVGSSIELRPVEYSPLELREMALEISALIDQDEAAFASVAGIDPEASEQAIYVLIKEELDSDSIEQIRSIFPDVEFVPVSESTGFTEDG